MTNHDDAVLATGAQSWLDWKSAWQAKGYQNRQPLRASNSKSGGFSTSFGFGSPSSLNTSLAIPRCNWGWAEEP